MTSIVSHSQSKPRAPGGRDIYAVDDDSPRKTPSTFIARLAAKIPSISLPTSRASSILPSISVGGATTHDDPAATENKAQPDHGLQAITQHRRKPTGLELKCSWVTGPSTWVPEAEVQELDPSALRTYWGQAKDPELRRRISSTEAPYISAHRLVWEADGNSKNKIWTVEVYIRATAPGSGERADNNGPAGFQDDGIIYKGGPSQDQPDNSINYEDNDDDIGEWFDELEAHKHYNAAVLTYLFTLPETRSKRNRAHPESRQLTSRAGKKAEKVLVLHRICKVLRYSDEERQKVVVQFSGYSEKKQDTEEWSVEDVQTVAPQQWEDFKSVEELGT